MAGAYPGPGRRGMLPAPMSDPGRLKPTTRFADRVADYVRFRPSYPPDVIRTLHDELGLRAGQVVADVGSGTGILSRLLVDNGNIVYGVEPSAEMAEAALAALGRTGRFHDVRGTAEETNLPPASADLATAAQAFHWFDVDAAREQFRRILRPPRPVAVVWNLRRTDTDVGYNGGAGLKLALGPAALFVEARYYSVRTKPDKTNFVPVTIGLSF